jgi:hypothetical protein
MFGVQAAALSVSTALVVLLALAPGPAQGFSLSKELFMPRRPIPALGYATIRNESENGQIIANYGYMN